MTVPKEPQRGMSLRLLFVLCSLPVVLAIVLYVLPPLLKKSQARKEFWEQVAQLHSRSQSTGVIRGEDMTLLEITAQLNGVVKLASLAEAFSSKKRDAMLAVIHKYLDEINKLIEAKPGLYGYDVYEAKLKLRLLCIDLYQIAGMPTPQARPRYY